MSGGIGESLLIGAAVGGGTALVTGNDPLQGALLGGVTGGIGGAMSGAAASTVANTGANTVTNASNALGTNLAAYAAPNMATQAATQAATNTGIAGLAPTDVFGLANYTGASAPNFATQAVADTVAAPMAEAASLGDLAAAGQDMIPQSAMSAGASADKGLFGGFNDWYGGLSTGEKIGYGIAGGVALQGLSGGLSPQGVEIPDEDEDDNPMGLATYNRKSFTPYQATPNVYRPNYANGGIASLPRGNMYPQGMQDSTQYATSPQMPASAAALRADYDAMTNPYSGEPIGMADGGSTRDAVTEYLGKTPREALASYMGSMDVRKTPTSEVIATQPAPAPAPAPAQPAAPKSWENMTRDERRAFAQQIGMPMNEYRNPFTGGNYMGMGAMGGMGGTAYMYGNPSLTRYERPAAATDTNMAKNFQTYETPTANTQIYRPQFANGGITGNGHLGDYAAGGMPRLLRGPGDGVSDNIPATIAGKQPARLADGEFVVPARIVSELGNGSTDAGAKRLYAMMDRVQKKRGKTVGKNKVAVDSKAHKELAKV